MNNDTSLQVIDNVAGTAIEQYANRNVIRELVDRLMSFHPAAKEVGKTGMMAAAQLAVFMGASPLPSLNEIHIWQQGGKTNISLGINYWRRQGDQRGGVLWDREPQPMTGEDYERYGVDQKSQYGAICRGVRLADVRELRELDIPIAQIMKMKALVGIGVCARSEHTKNGRPLIWNAIKRAETDFYKQAFPYMPGVSRPGTGLSQAADGTYRADGSAHWEPDNTWIVEDADDNIIEGVTVEAANDDLFGDNGQGNGRTVDTETGEILDGSPFADIRADLEGQGETVKAGFLADRLEMTGLYRNAHHALATMNKWPDLPNGKALKFANTVYTKTAVLIFDWCINRKDEEEE